MYGTIRNAPGTPFPGPRPSAPISSTPNLLRRTPPVCVSARPGRDRPWRPTSSQAGARNARRGAVVPRPGWIDRCGFDPDALTPRTTLERPFAREQAVMQEIRVPGLLEPNQPLHGRQCAQGPTASFVLPGLRGRSPRRDLGPGDFVRADAVPCFRERWARCWPVQAPGLAMSVKGTPFLSLTDRRRSAGGDTVRPAGVRRRASRQARSVEVSRTWRFRVREKSGRGRRARPHDGHVQRDHHRCRAAPALPGAVSRSPPAPGE